MIENETIHSWVVVMKDKLCHTLSQEASRGASEGRVADSGTLIKLWRRSAGVASEIQATAMRGWLCGQ